MRDNSFNHSNLLYTMEHGVQNDTLALNSIDVKGLVIINTTYWYSQVIKANVKRIKNIMILFEKKIKNLTFLKEN